jgi:signal transduction histidine kinase
MSLSKEGKGERIQRMLDVVQRNTTRLNALIARVIQEQKQSQRPGADSVLAAKMIKRHVDLWPLIEELLHDFQTLMEPKRVSSRNDVPHSCSIFADPVLIVQVFQNLLSNAIENTSDGEIAIGAAISDAERLVRCWV